MKFNYYRHKRGLFPFLNDEDVRKYGVKNYCMCRLELSENHVVWGMMTPKGEPIAQEEVFSEDQCEKFDGFVKSGNWIEHSIV